MLRGNWHKHPKAGLVGGLLAAFVFCLGVIGLAHLQAVQYERDANDRANEYAEYTLQKVSEACVGISGRERVICLNEAFEAQREYENTQQDLTAQQKAALWAFVMGAAAVVGMALSAVGVWLVKRTFDETRKSADAAQKTLNATVAIERGRLALRPLSVRASKKERGYADVNIAADNYGGTPCRIVRCYFQQMATPEYPGFMPMGIEVGVTVAGGDKVSFNAGFVMIDSVRSQPYFTCCVEFISAFDTTHHVRLLVKIGQLNYEDIVVRPGQFTVAMLPRPQHQGWPEDDF